MPIPVIGSVLARSAVSTFRYASSIVRTRSGKVIAGATFAEKISRPIRFGYSSTRAYSHSISGRRRNRTENGSLRRRNASFEYIYKY